MRTRETGMRHYRYSNGTTSERDMCKWRRLFCTTEPSRSQLRTATPAELAGERNQQPPTASHPPSQGLNVHQNTSKRFLITVTHVHSTVCMYVHSYIHVSVALQCEEGTSSG